MKKFEILDMLVDEGNGYLLTAKAIESGVSKTTLAEYVRARNMERVAQGIYFSEDEWFDNLYLLSMKNPKIYFSHETALYLHGFMEREPRRVTVTVKNGYNATHLRKNGIRVYQVKEEQYELGASSVLTNYGNLVAVYDKERTICDIIKNKEKMDIQVFQTAMKEYMLSSEKKLHNLMQYARKMKIEENVRNYTEVML